MYLRCSQSYVDDAGMRKSIDAYNCICGLHKAIVAIHNVCYIVFVLASATVEINADCLGSGLLLKGFG